MSAPQRVATLTAPLCLLLVLVATCSFAKSPAHCPKHDLDILTGSLTPPPKEWAMFPQDEPPQTPQNAQSPSNTSAGGAAQNGTGSLISAPNDPAHAAHPRELPVFWLLVLGALSLCAVTACGNLILRNEEPAAEITDGGVPEVSEEQEIKS